MFFSLSASCEASEHALTTLRHPNSQKPDSIYISIMPILPSQTLNVKYKNLSFYIFFPSCPLGRFSLQPLVRHKRPIVLARLPSQILHRRLSPNAPSNSTALHCMDLCRAYSRLSPPHNEPRSNRRANGIKPNEEHQAQRIGKALAISEQFGVRKWKLCFRWRKSGLADWPDWMPEPETGFGRTREDCHPPVADRRVDSQWWDFGGE